MVEDFRTSEQLSGEDHRAGGHRRHVVIVAVKHIVVRPAARYPAVAGVGKACQMLLGTADELRGPGVPVPASGSRRWTTW